MIYQLKNIKIHLRNMNRTESRSRYLAKFRKKLWGRGFRRINKTTPLFVAGSQRSGTSMMMNVFHFHPEVEVYDEAYNSKVFKNFRVRNVQILDKSLQQSRFPYACYKIICDSHILSSFIEAFPNGKFVWVYRGAADNAESALRKFPHATRAIRLVIQDQSGGGWFAEGVSQGVAKALRKVASRDLTEFDYACLVWWARNNLFFELGLERVPCVRVLQYEDLVQDPRLIMDKLFRWLNLGWSESAFRFVHAKSVAKPGLPKLDPKVKALCDELKERLDHEWVKDWN